MMKSRYLVLTSLLILLILTQAGCGQPASVTPPVETPPTEPPGATEPATELPTEQPAIPLAPVEKPSLLLVDEQGAMGQFSVAPAHAVAFVFPEEVTPEGLVAMKATAVNNSGPGPDDMTIVGVVEVGPEAEKINTGTYIVAIDLLTEDSPVLGRLLNNNSELELLFERTELERNPARSDSPSFPNISPIIKHDGVCFVIGLATPGEISQTSNAAELWFRYCSKESTETGEFLLSVQDNFPGPYGNLSSRVEAAMAHLDQLGIPQPANIDFNQIISEMEGHNNLNACNNNQGCFSDITGAPNASFWDDFAQAQDAAGGNNFVVTAGIVKVERELNVPGQDTIQPGDYWVRDWFDQEGNFLGATLFGLTTADEPVNGQPIPAIPAYFVDKDNPKQVVSWISGWRLCDWCKWQSNCP